MHSTVMSASNLAMTLKYVAKNKGGSELGSSSASTVRRPTFAPPGGGGGERPSRHSD